ncbi:hypothetical protein [Mariniblastus fucicola]|uniref:PEP-CTERM protein-sorting domain-containing protein n=1 Tax=Mariniblastus fucicola TaxID=980251 RepID=A0A5B9PA85_9BACT|nr:hypothetical protein [Mariniblastus fucicola]QEG21872.1 hypothetical protein MFFC18_17330 [Mariniblastus fucicola]
MLNCRPPIAAGMMLLVCVFSVFNSTASAQPADVSVNFFQQSLGDGNVSYGVDIQSTGIFFGFAGNMGSVESPDGTEFTLFNRGLDGLDFQTLGNRFFGDWTVFEATSSGDAVHSFTLSSFDLDDVFNEIPTFTGPVASGESGNIGTEFNLTWEYASGATPSGQTVRAGGSGGRATFGQFGTNTVPVSVELDEGVSSATITFRAGGFEFVDGIVSDVELVSGNGSDLTANASFSTLAEPIQLTITAVPEPGSALIACLGLLVCAPGYRRRNLA